MQEADKGLGAGKHTRSYYAFSMSFHLSFMAFPVNAVKKKQKTNPQKKSMTQSLPQGV